MSSRGGEKGLSFRDVLFSGYAKVNAQHGIYFMSLIRVHLIIIRHGNPDIFQLKTFEILLQNYFASFVYFFHAFTSKKEKKRYRKLIKPTCPKICDHNYHYVNFVNVASKFFGSILKLSEKLGRFKNMEFVGDNSIYSFMIHLIGQRKRNKSLYVY